MIEWHDTTIRWAARLAMAFYLAALIARISSRDRFAREAWTAGFVAILVHLAASFHFVHAWSHASAYAEIAARTNETFGKSWGGGIYANYAYAVVWGADVLWWRFWPRSYLGRPRWIEAAIQAYLGFIAFNATVVFGHGPIRWAGVVGCIVVVGAAWKNRGFRSRATTI